LCRSNISFQELAVEAALHGDHEAAYHAFLLDPVTAAALAPHEIRNMVDEMLEAQMQWIPQFQGKSNTAPGHKTGRLPTGVKEIQIGENVHARLFASGKEPA
jgi:hypothetical protein